MVCDYGPHTNTIEGIKKEYELSKCNNAWDFYVERALLNGV